MTDVGRLRLKVRELQEELDEVQEGGGRVKTRRYWTDHVITFVVAAVAVAGTLLAANHSSGEDREAESRARRSQVYAEYLKAAATYRDRGYQAWAVYASTLKNPMIPYNVVRPTYQAFEEARREYRDKANQVAIYGSPAAWEAQKTITSSMLSSLVPVQVKNKPGGPDFDIFNRGYKEFVMVFCEDAAALDKTPCRPARGDEVGATR